jgi:hypothetical protein
LKPGDSSRVRDGGCNKVTSENSTLTPGDNTTVKHGKVIQQ